MHGGDHGKRQQGAQIAILLGGMAAVATIHGYFVVPSILSRTQEQIDRSLDRHVAAGHPDRVTRHEFTAMDRRMDEILSELRELRRLVSDK